MPITPPHWTPPPDAKYPYYSHIPDWIAHILFRRRTLWSAHYLYAKEYYGIPDSIMLDSGATNTLLINSAIAAANAAGNSIPAWVDTPWVVPNEVVPTGLEFFHMTLAGLEAGDTMANTYNAAYQSICALIVWQQYVVTLGTTVGKLHIFGRRGPGLHDTGPV